MGMVVVEVRKKVGMVWWLRSDISGGQVWMEVSVGGGRV